METNFYSMEFFFFHENFSTYIQKDSLQYFSMLCSYFQNNECKNNLDIREGRQEQWNPTSTAWIFFSFTRIFLYTFRNIPYSFFVCSVRISRIMNAKKSRNSRGKTRAMESHFYSMEFFFAFTRIFLHTFWKIPYNFFYAVFGFPE